MGEPGGGFVGAMGHTDNGFNGLLFYDGGDGSEYGFTGGVVEVEAWFVEE